MEEAAASFEALFLQHLLQSMRKTVPKSGLIDTGFAGETFLAMLDDALAQEMAKAGGIGLARTSSTSWLPSPRAHVPRPAARTEERGLSWQRHLDLCEVEVACVKRNLPRRRWIVARRRYISLPCFTVSRYSSLW